MTQARRTPPLNCVKKMQRINAEHQRLRKFVRMISRMTMDGEEVDGEPFIMENDDAVATVNHLIDDARLLLAKTRGAT